MFKSIFRKYFIKRPRFYVTKATLRESDDVTKRSKHKRAVLESNYLYRDSPSTNHDQLSHEGGRVVGHTVFAYLHACLLYMPTVFHLL